MLLDYGVVIHAVLLVLGLLWTLEIFKRLPNDRDEFRNATDSSERLVIALYWAATVMIDVWMLVYVFGLLRQIQW